MEVLRVYNACVRKLLLKIMAVLAKVGTLHKRLGRPMPLLLLYCTPSFGCSSFFAYRGQCKNCLFDQCAWAYAMLYVEHITLLCVQVRTGFYDLCCTYMSLHVQCI